MSLCFSIVRHINKFCYVSSLRHINHAIYSIAIYFFIIYGLFGFVACNEQSSANADQTTNEVSNLHTTPQNTQNIANSPLRVIVTYRPATQLIFALRQPHTLVGVHDQADKLPLFQFCYPPITKLPQVGSKAAGVNIETIARLHPNLVILHTGSSGLNTQKKLQALKIQSYLLQIESISQMKQSIVELGNLLNVPEYAKQTNDELERILGIVKNNLAKYPPSQKKRVYISSTQNFLSSHSHVMLQHEMIQTALCEDVCTVEYGGWATISAEQLLQWNPDIAIISGAAPYTTESIVNSPKFQNLQAVKNTQVYRMPHEKISDWDYPSPDIVLGILWIAKTAYPESFKDIIFEQELEHYYQTVYGADYAKITK